MIQAELRKEHMLLQLLKSQVTRLFLLGVLVLLSLACAHADRVNIADLGAVPNDPASAEHNIAIIQNAIDDQNPAWANREEIFFPAGVWYINRPIYLDRVNITLCGEDQNTSIIKAAPGYKGMLMLFQAWAIEPPSSEPTQADRPALTDIYDASVTEPHFGLRTYTETPDAKTYHYGGTNKGNWQSGTAYAVGDFVTVGGNESTGVYVCTRAHASEAPWISTNGDPQPADWLKTTPGQGTDWQTYWAKRRFSMASFVAGPFTGGAVLDAKTGETSHFNNLDNFTLDIGVKNNMTTEYVGNIFWSPMHGNTPIFCLDTYPYDIYRTRLSVLLDDGSKIEDILPHSILPGQASRMTLQWSKNADNSHILAFWRSDPDDGVVRLAVRKTIPAWRTLASTDEGAFSLGVDNWWGAIYQFTPDATFFGCHFTASARYPVGALGSVQSREDALLPTDQFRFFDNAADTIAYLPFTDNWQDSTPHQHSDLYRYGPLITVQHGAAAGDAGQKSFGLWRTRVDGGNGGLSNQSIHDLTIANADPGEFYPWGAAVVTDYLLGARFYNLNLRGGAYGIYGINGGCNAYVLDLHDSTLQGCEAAYYEHYMMTNARNISIPTPGRYGIYAPGGVPNFSGISFGKPGYTGSYTEYLVSAVVPVGYLGGMQEFSHITCNNAGQAYPSKAAFQLNPEGGPFQLHDVTIASLPRDAAFLVIPKASPHAPCGFEVYRCTVNSAVGGKTFADFIRNEDPMAYGRIYDCSASMPVKTWVNINDLEGGEKNNNVLTFHTDLATIPSPGKIWTQGAHILSIGIAEKMMEYHCTIGGESPTARWIGFNAPAGLTTGFLDVYQEKSDGVSSILTEKLPANRPGAGNSTWNFPTIPRLVPNLATHATISPIAPETSQTNHIEKLIDGTLNTSSADLVNACYIDGAVSAGLLFNLQGNHALTDVVTYSWNSRERTSQKYELYLSSAADAPACDATDLSKAALTLAGWSYEATVNTSAGFDGQLGVDVHFLGPKRNTRYLLLVAHPASGMKGTAFAEIAVLGD